MGWEIEFLHGKKVFLSMRIPSFKYIYQPFMLAYLDKIDLLNTAKYL